MKTRVGSFATLSHSENFQIEKQHRLQILRFSLRGSDSRFHHSLLNHIFPQCRHLLLHFLRLFY